MAEDNEDAVSLPVVWVGNDEVVIQYANQFMMQMQRGEFLLSFGQLSPPAVIGTPEEQREQLRGYPFVAVRTVARFALPRQGADELVQLLNRMIEQYDQAYGGQPE